MFFKSNILLECVTCRLKAFFILGVGSLRAATAAAGGAATLLGSRSAGGVIWQEEDGLLSLSASMELFYTFLIQLIQPFNLKSMS